MITNLGRSEVALLTNKDGSDLPFGAVVIVDSANAASFKTTSTAGYFSGRVGVIVDPNGIVDDGVGLVAFCGFVSQINLDGSAGIGDLVKSSATNGEGSPHSAPNESGDFAQAIGSGTSPAALLFGMSMPIVSGAGAYFAPTGLTGATDASRYVGGTTSGSPVTGTFEEGDYVIDQTGKIWICTTAGSPGAWDEVGSGGGGGGRTLIQQNTPTGAGTTSFTSIPGTYKKLTLEYSIRSTQLADKVDIVMKFNADATAGNYRYVIGRANIFGNASDNGSTYRLATDGAPGSFSDSGSFGFGVTQIVQYANTNFQKTAITNFGTYDAAGGQNISMGNLRWLDTSAITQIDVELSAGNFDTGSVLRLYGED